MYADSIVMCIMTYITLSWLYMNKMHMKHMRQYVLFCACQSIKQISGTRGHIDKKE